MSVFGMFFIGLLAGWLAGLIMRGGGFGLMGNLLVGVAGAFLGGFLFQTLGVNVGGVIGSLVTATTGAILLLTAVGLLKQP